MKKQKRTHNQSMWYLSTLLDARMQYDTFLITTITTDIPYAHMVHSDPSNGFIQHRTANIITQIIISNWEVFVIQWLSDNIPNAINFKWRCFYSDIRFYWFRFTSDILFLSFFFCLCFAIVLLFSGWRYIS